MANWLGLTIIVLITKHDVSHVEISMAQQRRHRRVSWYRLSQNSRGIITSPPRGVSHRYTGTAHWVIG